MHRQEKLLQTACGDGARRKHIAPQIKHPESVKRKPGASHGPHRTSKNCRRPCTVRRKPFACRRACAAARRRKLLQTVSWVMVRAANTLFRPGTTLTPSRGNALRCMAPAMPMNHPDAVRRKRAASHGWVPSLGPFRFRPACSGIWFLPTLAPSRENSSQSDQTGKYFS